MVQEELGEKVEFEYAYPETYHFSNSKEPTICLAWSAASKKSLTLGQ
jgi:hypothetical protein